MPSVQHTHTLLRMQKMKEINIKGLKLVEEDFNDSKKHKHKHKVRKNLDGN